ncbi:MAG: RNA-binding protein [Rhodospirillaceae bacterium]|nr:RNA-binding protein [Rhodospirillaceae bacterium]
MPDRSEEPASARRCIVTGESAPRCGLIRFAIGPDGTLVPDLAERLPGRGLWMTARRDIVARAAPRQVSRAARTAVAVFDPMELADLVERLLGRRLVELIGLARRAGQAVAGFEKVKAWCREGRAAALLAASDGGADGRAKVRALAPQAGLIDVLTAEELGLAFARPHAVHGALAPGGLATEVEREAARLAGFRAAPGHEGLHEGLKESAAADGPASMD